MFYDDDCGDYDLGLLLGRAGKPLPRYASDAFIDGHVDGLAERDYMLERKLDERAARARERRRNAKSDPYRTVRPVRVAAPILRKAAMQT